MQRRSFLKALAALPIVGGAVAKLIPAAKAEQFATGGILTGLVLAGGPDGGKETILPLDRGIQVTMNISTLDPNSFRELLIRDKEKIRNVISEAITSDKSFRRRIGRA